MNLRSEPGLGYEMLTQLSDGSRVELTGEAQTAEGFSWQHVRLDGGRLAGREFLIFNCDNVNTANLNEP